MSAVGLFYVGAVLFINAVMLLGRMTPRESAPLNLFVGALQVITPTILIITADGDPALIFAASGLYLFGFTYLWVGVNGATGWPGRGLGWFSLFVSASAIGFAAEAFRADDPAFGVIWLLWSVLWFLFFLVLGLERVELGPFTGIVAGVEAFLTAAVPAFLILTGRWESTTTSALVIAAIGLLMLASAGPLARQFVVVPAQPAQPAQPSP
ncbi:transporter [Phytoactinopolyspora alkaliphila]|uniref:Transporter n=1 Tax=Phytoactinopolyspora alkaliphila TaxID=1783498 RepID=A0A6N9YNT2_9ACTN|nr:AmiS/UreI family transporter [Phytoactinopolyspora alkaliphila]NED96721.1 transporter [Phytoactinopolyspora alkaliphila]